MLKIIKIINETKLFFHCSNLCQPFFATVGTETLLFQKNYSVIYIKEEENTTLANGNQPAEEIEIFECTE